MKPQTKINILVAIETTEIIAGTIALMILYLSGSVIAFLPIPAAVVVSSFFGLYIKKSVLELTWREAWADFWDLRW